MLGFVLLVENWDIELPSALVKESLRTRPLLQKSPQIYVLNAGGENIGPVNADPRLIKKGDPSRETG